MKASISAGAPSACVAAPGKVRLDSAAQHSTGTELDGGVDA